MAKFCGNVGYIETIEVEPGVWLPQETLLPYFGDWVRYARRFQVSSDSTNDNSNVSNELSIVSDPYAIKHFSSIRFIEDEGIRWKVTAIEPKYPRLILTIGGLYNDGEQAGIAE